MSRLSELQKERIRYLWIANESPVIAERLGRSTGAIQDFVRLDPACIAHQRPPKSPDSVGAINKKLRRLKLAR